jgi:hypothetical protein
MNDLEYQKERRRQRRVEQFPSGAHCLFCNEDDPHCLERHHVAGKAFGDEQVIVCRNHHRKLSDKQKDRPPVTAGDPTRHDCLGRLLLGIADIMDLLNNPADLIGLVRQSGVAQLESA